MTKLGSRKLHICAKVTKMGSIIGHGIDFLGCSRKHTNLLKYPPGGCFLYSESRGERNMRPLRTTAWEARGSCAEGVGNDYFILVPSGVVLFEGGLSPQGPEEFRKNK